jgi:glycosyltransferase involved in cell wall biosynthesis
MTFTVANVISSFNSKSGGPPRTVSLIAAAGSGLWRADLFTTDYQESASDSLLVDEFPGPVHVARGGSHGLLGGLAMLAGLDHGFSAQLLRGGVPDIVHIHGIWSPFLAVFAAAARRHGIPYVVSPHGMLEPWSLRVSPMRKALALRLYQRRILEQASALHTTSEMEAANLGRLAFDGNKIHVVPNPVEEPSEHVGTDKVAPNRERVLLFLSRIHPKKGLDILLRAWNVVRPDGWRLLIVGSGEAAYSDSLSRYCADHEVPRVDFHAHVEGAAREDIFRRASAFVLPTYSENFGNVVAEALIRKLPVITTTGTPWSGIVTHGCGWYIEPTLEALQGALRAATSLDAGRLADMGARGSQYARAHFTLPRVREGLLSMYRAALEKDDDLVAQRTM